MPDDTTDSFDAWVERGPLRVWRLGQGYSILRAAVTFDVSVTTIQNWERGVCLPTGERETTVITVLGARRYNQWKRWQAERSTTAAA